MEINSWDVQCSWRISSVANPGHSCPNDAKSILFVEPKLLVWSKVFPLDGFLSNPLPSQKKVQPGKTTTFTSQKNDILFMEEVLHHLGCIKLHNNGIYLPYQLVFSPDFWTFHQQYHDHLPSPFDLFARITLDIQVPSHFRTPGNPIVS